MEKLVSTLERRLRLRIETGGPITFAEFMDNALYDPDEGFYSHPPIGVEGHYVTSPHVSGAFADLLARNFMMCWDSMDRPSPLDVLEVGAGDGTLSGQIQSGMHEAAETLRYRAVERSSGARDAIERRGISAHPSLAEIEPFTGIVVANELLDNLPFHRLAERSGEVLELMVGVDGNRFVLVEGRPSPDAIAALRRPLSRDEERPVSPATDAFVSELGAVLLRGYVFLFDYGFGEGSPAQQTRSYRNQDVIADVLANPGSRDISAGVDFDSLASAAHERGFEVWGPVSQRDGLFRLGFREWLHALRDRQLAAEAAGEWRQAVTLFGERSRAPMLVDEAQLGSLKLIVLGRDVPRPPRLFENR